MDEKMEQDVPKRDDEAKTFSRNDLINMDMQTRRDQASAIESSPEIDYLRAKKMLGINQEGSDWIYTENSERIVKVGLSNGVLESGHTVRAGDVFILEHPEKGEKRLLVKKDGVRVTYLQGETYEGLDIEDPVVLELPEDIIINGAYPIYSYTEYRDLPKHEKDKLLYSYREIPKQEHPEVKARFGRSPEKLKTINGTYVEFVVKPVEETTK